MWITNQNFLILSGSLSIWMMLCDFISFSFLCELWKTNAKAIYRFWTIMGSYRNHNYHLYYAIIATMDVLPFSTSNCCLQDIINSASHFNFVLQRQCIKGLGIHINCEEAIFFYKICLHKGRNSRCFSRLLYSKANFSNGPVLTTKVLIRMLQKEAILKTVVTK